MGLLDTLTAWFKREKADITQAKAELEERLEDDLHRRERSLTASPEERLAMIQDEITDDPFAEIRAKLDRTSARAELDQADANPTPDPPQ